MFDPTILVDIWWKSKEKQWIDNVFILTVKELPGIEPGFDKNTVIEWIHNKENVISDM